MELPQEIINIIICMMSKDSDRKSPKARLLKTSNDIETFITCKNIKWKKNVFRSNNFYLLRCEILKNII